MQGFVDSTIERAMNDVTNKFQHKLEILKDNKIVLKLWNHYKNSYHKVYQSVSEEKDRLEKFIGNLKFIIKENLRFEKGVKSFKLHLNEFGDMNLSEMRQKMTGLRVDYYVKSLSIHQRPKRFLFDSVKKKINKFKDKIKKKLRPGKGRNDSNTFDGSDRSTRRTTTKRVSASKIDYRPYMNPIVNQGQCGSCYAFSVTAAIEGTYALKTGRRIQLSQQQIVDCSANYGCSGGFFETTFQYIKQNGGLESDASYPYVGTQQSCYARSANMGSIQGFGTTPHDDEEEMKRALITYGPLAAGICITGDLQFYGSSEQAGASDIIDIPSCSKAINHAITIVGFGTDIGKDYWLVRNSWGENWGLNGYFKIARNKNSMCGIATYGYYTQI
ncbi:unnamed protein product [Adineta ricciae]|uniref:Uncharacterized protein n=1 Tax=Adineta ricciae TaxID=249248 RepID=A0A815AF99_ADIRI|nr:unnamed protein product [Adineta ricciae]